MNQRAIIMGGLLIVLLYIASFPALMLFGAVLSQGSLLGVAFIWTSASIILGSAYAARRAGKSHILHGILAAMVCFNLVLPLAIFYGRDLVAINPDAAIGGIINYSLFGSIGGLLAKYTGRRR